MNNKKQVLITLLVLMLNNLNAMELNPASFDDCQAKLFALFDDYQAQHSNKNNGLLDTILERDSSSNSDDSDNSISEKRMKSIIHKKIVTMEMTQNINYNTNQVNNYNNETTNKNNNKYTISIIMNTNKNNKSINNELHSYECKILIFAKHINDWDTQNQFSDLIFSKINDNTTKYNIDFLKNIMKYAFSKSTPLDNESIFHNIKFILSNKFVQNNLNFNFKNSDIINLEDVIKLLNKVNTSKHNDIIKQVINLTLFNFNSIQDIYNSLYNSKDKFEIQTAVNEFLRLIKNPLLLKIYFIIHEKTIFYELRDLFHILNNRNNNKTLYNGIDQNTKSKLLNVLLDYEIDTNSYKKFETDLITEIKSKIVQTLIDKKNNSK